MKKLLFILFVTVIAAGVTACGEKVVDYSSTGLVGTWALDEIRHIEKEITPLGVEKNISHDAQKPTLPELITLEKDGTGSSKVGLDEPFSFTWELMDSYFVRRIGGATVSMAMETKSQWTFRISEFDTETDDDGTRHENTMQYVYIRAY